MKNFKKLIGSVLLVGIILLPLVSCSKEKESLPEAKGYQWEVTKDNKTMYMMGTIHITDTKHNYMTDTIKNILDKSDELATEINMMAPTTTAKIQESVIYTGGKTIESDLSKKEIDDLKELCKEVNFDYNNMKILKPTGIISNITYLYYLKAGCNGEAVDTAISNYMNQNKKGLVALETVESQIRVLEETQGIQALKEYLKEYESGSFYEDGEEAIKEARELSDAYINGDEEYIKKSADTMMNGNKELYDIMLKNRNEKMVEGIEKLFKEDKTYTIAVGALHYFGEDSILRILEEKGYTINKL